MFDLFAVEVFVDSTHSLADTLHRSPKQSSSMLETHHDGNLYTHQNQLQTLCSLH
jgi:hypothetical protein